MTKTTTRATGANVKAEMARRGVTQTELAARLNITQSALSKRLRGAVSINVDELAAIGHALDVPVFDLLASAEVSAA